MTLLNPRFLTLDEVKAIHRSQIEGFGGSVEIRDEGLLLSALAQPEAGFGECYLHESLEDMAGAYLFHIVKNHPFVDGNKRTGTAAALVFLELNHVELQAEVLDRVKRTTSSTLLEELVIRVASGNTDKTEIAKFFKKYRQRPQFGWALRPN
ncbi:MAG: type II toxin-antitoxin system death-on-curing family toxin [Bradymonadales bacterium]|nr:MAG: type II toxin-antitoxin system death-on-curing family toxin [Bradymonadales bacterium]